MNNPPPLTTALHDRPDPPANCCRLVVKWSARVLSAPLILLFSIALAQAPFAGNFPEKREQITAALFLLVTLLLAMRWEILGGALLFIGTSACAWHTKMHDEPWSFYIAWVLACLFLSSGSFKLAVKRAHGARAIKAETITGLVFTFLALIFLGGCFASGAASKFNG